MADKRLISEPPPPPPPPQPSAAAPGLDQLQRRMSKIDETLECGASDKNSGCHTLESDQGGNASARFLSLSVTSEDSCFSFLGFFLQVTEFFFLFLLSGELRGRKRETK